MKNHFTETMVRTVARIRLYGLLLVCTVLIFSTSTTSLWAAGKTDPKTAVEAAEKKVEKIFAGGEPTSVEDLKAMQEHVRKLSIKVTPCTVGVQIGQAQGSGVIISKDGYVLTAAHVSGRPNVDVTFILADGRKVKGKTLGLNHGIDSGLMKITTPGEWPFLEMGNSANLKQGQWCLATGHPGGYVQGRPPVVRLGRVLDNTGRAVVTDCVLVGGDSGGPLFDMDGKVIAINSRIGQQLTANLHVPIDTFRDTWDRLEQGEDWGKLLGDGPFLGVQGDPKAKIAKITEVFPNTPAAKAGIKPGDVITKFDGKDIPNFIALSSLVRGKKPGDKVKVEVLRGEETVALEVTLGKRGK